MRLPPFNSVSLVGSGPLSSVGQVSRPAVLSGDSGGFFIMPQFIRPQPSHTEVQTNPIQLRKEPDACLPLRPESSVTYFPLLATGAGDPVAFLGPLSRHHNPRRN